jgi:hypothetical protein
VPREARQCGLQDAGSARHGGGPWFGLVTWLLSHLAFPLAVAG